jgi:hypothetical protein
MVGSGADISRHATLLSVAAKIPFRAPDLDHAPDPGMPSSARENENQEQDQDQEQEQDREQDREQEWRYFVCLIPPEPITCC